MLRAAGQAALALNMAVIWSMAFTLLAMLVYYNKRAAAVIGLLVFSHWTLDFISWNTLPLFFGRAPGLGLGLYNSISDFWKIGLELTLFVPGLAVYIFTRSQLAKQGKFGDNDGKERGKICRESLPS